jgi:hypothetical protein
MIRIVAFLSPESAASCMPFFLNISFMLSCSVFVLQYASFFSLIFSSPDRTYETIKCTISRKSYQCFRMRERIVHVGPNVSVGPLGLINENTTHPGALRHPSQEGGQIRESGIFSLRARQRQSVAIPILCRLSAGYGIFEFSHGIAASPEYRLLATTMMFVIPPNAGIQIKRI